MFVGHSKKIIYHGNEKKNELTLLRAFPVLKKLFGVSRNEISDSVYIFINVCTNVGKKVWEKGLFGTRLRIRPRVDRQLGHPRPYHLQKSLMDLC